MSKSARRLRPRCAEHHRKGQLMQLPSQPFIFCRCVIWFILWVGVSSARTRLKRSIGDGGDPTLLQTIRRHGNFIEWVPFTLILLTLAEVQGTRALWLHAAGILLVIGRVVRPFRAGHRQRRTPLALCWQRHKHPGCVYPLLRLGPHCIGIVNNKQPQKETNHAIHAIDLHRPQT